MEHNAITGLRCTTVGPAETQKLAAALASVLVDGDLLVLTGDLGAGKTCFTQGLGRGLGIEDRITSPTFTLANRYDGRLRLNHLDVYRLESEAESLDLGLDELLDDGVTVIEWGNKISGVLPQDHLTIALRHADLPEEIAWDDPRTEQRIIEFTLGAGWAGRNLDVALAQWLATA